VVGNLIRVLLQISSRLQRSKNFENRPVFDEVMPKILLVRFFPDMVYSRSLLTVGCEIEQESLANANVKRATAVHV